MKDTKRYRAGTLREALEQVKQDLGEDALVLGHKRICAGGVLGIGTSELIDYLRGAHDLLKCLVLQATTHPVDALVAVKKFGLFGCDQLIITKLDETTRPGASV